MRKGFLIFGILVIGLLYIYHELSYDAPVYGFHGGCEIVDDYDGDVTVDGPIYIEKRSRQLIKMKQAEHAQESRLAQIRDEIVDFIYHRHNVQHHHGAMPEKHRITCEPPKSSH